MKNFEDLMTGISERRDIPSEAVEQPKDINEIGDTTERLVDTTEKSENLKDMVESGSLQMSWTKVNTSNSCGCNNACYNSCYNIG